MSLFLRPVINRLSTGEATSYQLNLGVNQGANVARSVPIPALARKARIGVNKNVRYFFGNPPPNHLPYGFQLIEGTHDIDVGEDSVLTLYKEDSTNVAAAAYVEFYGGDENRVRVRGDHQYLKDPNGAITLTGGVDTVQSFVLDPNTVRTFRVPTNTKSITFEPYDITQAFRYTTDGSDPSETAGILVDLEIGEVYTVPELESNVLKFHEVDGRQSGINITYSRNHLSNSCTHLLVNGAQRPFAFTTDGSDPSGTRGIYVSANTATKIPCYKGGIIKAIDAGIPASQNAMEWQGFSDPTMGGSIYEENRWRPVGGEYKDDFNSGIATFDVPGTAKWAWIGARLPFEHPNPPPTGNENLAKISTNGLDPQSGADYGTGGYLLKHNASIKIPLPSGTENLKIRSIHSDTTVTILYFGL